MDNGRSEAQRDTGRSSVAVVAEESDDGAYEIHVTTDRNEAVAQPAADEGSHDKPAETAVEPGRRRWPLLIVAAVLVGGIVLAVGTIGDDTVQPQDGTPASPDDSPTFRAWIVPSDPPAERPRQVEESEESEPVWQGEPQVAGVVYRGPDVEGEVTEEREQPTLEVIRTTSAEPARRPVIDAEPTRLPERWAPSEPVQIDPATRSRLERVPILTVDSDEYDEELTDEDDWEDDELLDDEVVDEDDLDDGEILEEDLDEGWED